MQKQAHEEGLGFLKDGIKWSEGQNLNRLQLKLVDELVVWLMRLKRFDEAELYASQHDLILGSADQFQLSQPHHKMAARSIVYLFWHRQQYTCAKQVLEILISQSRQVGQQRKAALYLCLLALTERANNQVRHSQERLIEALRIASTQSYFRLFIDEPSLHAPVAEMSSIDRSHLAKINEGFLKRLIQKIDYQPQNKNTLVEPLTGKEKEIIQQLESGLTNKKIAEGLFISEGTLKWHLHNIYSKLQVKNRTQALAEGRKQGYL